MSPARSTRTIRALLVVCLALLAGLPVLAAGPAQAAGLTQVTSFGSNPGALSMYVYRPDRLPAGAPVVVALHGCSQDAQTYLDGSGWRRFADERGILLVLPQQSTTNNSSRCFTWFEPGDTRRGEGEVASVIQMVDRAVADHGADAGRVHVTGLSAGGAMTAALLAAYPDRFAGGSVIAGIPYGCATSSLQAFGCMSPGVDKTPRQWGDLVRAAYPGYSGPRPRVAIWQGQSDTTVRPVNGEELRDQYTDVAGTGQTPTSTGTIGSSVTWEDHAGAVRLYRVAGMGHGTPVDPGTGPDQCGRAGAYFLDTVCAAYRDVLWFGLDGSTPSPTSSTSTAPTSTTTSASTSPTSTTSTTQVCVTSSNYAHTVAGRAYQSGGYTFATGSAQALGLWNVYTTTALQETSPGYWQRC